MNNPPITRTWAAICLALGLLTSVGGAAQSAVAQASNNADPAARVLTVDYLYNGINRPLMITIDGRAINATLNSENGQAEDQQIQLVILDHQGQVLHGPVAARAGRTDAAELLPDLWSLGEAAWLQCLVDGKAIGTPLVLQPMLSRMLPVTEQATRGGPNGPKYTRIIGWRSEAEPPSRAGGQDTESTRPPRRVCTGLRVYPDRDIVLKTSLGDIRLMMRPDEAPNTAWNFRTLCEGGYYRDIIFHRVVPMDAQGNPFVIQAGDPSGSGEGGPGHWVPIEPSELPHDFGVISMARTDAPDSAGSQFFLCLSEGGTSRLDVQYCSFGQTIAGGETIRAIQNVELADVRRGRPADPPRIISTSLVPAAPRAPGMGRTDITTDKPADDDDDGADRNVAASGRVDRLP